jgi:hypothetical protein
MGVSPVQPGEDARLATSKIESTANANDERPTTND